MTLPEFVEFPKIARLRRPVVVTEKIDGTNACVHITEDGRILSGSRTRWLTLEADNFGFCRWVTEHADELRELGPGTHFGEWWGSGVQRGYGLKEKRFSLFNVGRWNADGDLFECQKRPPACCGTVPVLARADKMSDYLVEDCINGLRKHGSIAAPGFMNPEGVVIFHAAGGHLYKVTLEKDEEPKGRAVRNAETAR